MQSAYLRERRATASTANGFFFYLYLLRQRSSHVDRPHICTTIQANIHTRGEKKTWQRQQKEQKQESQVDIWALVKQNIWNEALKTSQEGWQFREAWVKREDKQWELPERHTAVQLELKTFPNFQSFKAFKWVWSLELTWSKGSQSTDIDNKRIKIKLVGQTQSSHGNKAAINALNAANCRSIPHPFWTVVTLQVSPDAKVSYGINLAGSASAGAVSTYLCLHN